MFQRRVNGDVKFYRSLKRYKTGFGSIESGEYWLGEHTVKMNFKSPSNERMEVPCFLCGYVFWFSLLLIIFCRYLIRGWIFP